MSEEKKVNGENCGCGCGCEHDHQHEHDEKCGCGCEEVETLTVELEDENGNVIICEIVDGFEYNDKEYAVVHNPQDDSVYLFEVVGDDEVGELVLPSEEEFEEVSKYYEQLITEEK